MKLMQLAKSKDEKQIHRENSTRLLTQAENIKKASNWDPTATGHLLDFDPLSPTNNSTLDVAAFSSLQAAAPLATISSSSSTVDVASSLQTRKAIPPLPAEVVNLQGPKTCREISRAEDVLLWRGSALRNGPFPPWKGESGKFPGESDFTQGSPFVDNTDLNLSAQQLKILSGWQRPHDALPPPHLLNEHGRGSPLMRPAIPTDLVQDAATDCSVVASMCAGMARVEKGFSSLLGGFFFPFDGASNTPLLSPNGKYVVRLNFNGCFRKVVIDDRLPVTINDRLLHVIDRNNPRLLWPALLEKAYLKVRGGYDFPGSNSGTDLWILTGWLPEQIFLRLEATDVNKTWERMYRAFSYGDVLVTVGTGRLTKDAERKLGLVREHDYAILDLKQTEQGVKEVLIKNPWLNGPLWRGRYGIQNSRSVSSDSNSTDSDHEQTLVDLASSPTSESEKQPPVATPPGSFWMSFGDVVQHFESLYFNWNPGLFKYRADLHFEWDLSSGRSPLNSLRMNPQLHLQASMDGQLWVILSRHFPTVEMVATDVEPDDKVGLWLAEEPQPEESFISLYAFKNKGQRVIASRNAFTSSPFVDTPQTLLKFDARAYEPATMVPAEQGLPALIHNFTLSAFSQCPVQITQAKPRYADSISLSGRWTEDTAGGHAKCPTYVQNPQYSLYLPSQSHLAIVLESPCEDLSINVKLVHGQGKRIEAELRTQDIIIESGDYRRHCVVASTSKAYADNQPESKSVDEDERYVPAGNYTLILSTFAQGKPGDFTLTVASNVNASLNSIARSGAGRILRRFANVSFGPGVRRIGAPFTVCRLVTVYFVVKAVQHLRDTSRDERYESVAGGVPPSPVRLTVENGLGPDRTMIIASGDGAFMNATSASGVRTEDCQMTPARKTNRQAAVTAGATASREMWLILERMGLDLTKGEELFQVESWSDVPDWVKFGVWRDVS